MHKTDAARLKRQVHAMTKSHQCKVNGEFMPEVRSKELDSVVIFKMLNGKEYNAGVYCFLTECQHSIIVNKVKNSFCSLVSTNVKQMTLNNTE